MYIILPTNVRRKPIKDKKDDISPWRITHDSI